MDLGFETIGNATLICYDGGPVLATDPWIDGPAYFGSWTRTHEIPAEQRAAIAGSRFLWISHGHPDHLCPASLERLRGREILLPDHYGGRIRRALEADGFSVRILEDGKWTPLSDRIRVCCLADYCQDAVLLVDLAGRLIVNANDASDRGAGAFLKETVRRYGTSYLLALTGGDADMINFHDEDGARIRPATADAGPLGPGIAGLLDHYGIRSFVPFSSMHKYQRTDSAWANEFITPLSAHSEGFDRVDREILPPFVHCEFRGESQEVRSLDPAPVPDVLHPPEAFGDHWSDELEPEDVALLAGYLKRTTHLATFLGWVNFRVGGKDHVIDLARGRHDRGLTFETPRASLVAAARHEVFDDILIGNFAKTTAHGDWGGRVGTATLYPEFGPFLAKFGDNGGARSPAELRAYFAAYQRRGFLDFLPTPGHQAMRKTLATYVG